MADCDTCGASALLMVNVALEATGPTYTYRCPNGHITTTDFRSPPQDEGLRTQASVTDAPATSPPPPPFPSDGEVAGTPPEN